jgi:hypothetical protein
MELTSLGIDTLRLWFDDPCISSNPDLKVVRGDWYARLKGKSKLKEHKLWVDGQGNEVRGYYAKYHDYTLRVLVGPLPKRSARYPVTGCMVTFSVSKRKHGQHNLLPTDAEGLKGVLEGLQVALAELGIMVDVMRGTVSRLDLFRNVRLSQPFSEYIPILQLFSPPYLKYRNVYETGVTLGSKRCQWGIYNKREEMEGRRLRSEVPSENILRCELRLRNAQAVKDYLQIETAGDLLSSYDRLEPFYNEMVNKRLLKLSIPESPRGLQEYIEHYAHLARACQMPWSSWSG